MLASANQSATSWLKSGFELIFMAMFPFELVLETSRTETRRSGHPFFMSLYVAWFISLLIAGYSESAYQIINLFRRGRKRQHTTKIYKCYNNYEILIFLFCTLFLLLPLGINLASMLKLMLACVDTTR